MAIIDDVKALLADYAPHGWETLFSNHGLNILADDLATELEKNLDNIDRRIPGFKEFALEGRQGVTPGIPAQSLLYHAFASPLVQWTDASQSQKLTKFPTLEELELIENYIYAVREQSLVSLEAVFGRENLAVVMFAKQYRPAIDTLHKKHADMVYSRTGISRIGNVAAEYEPCSRSFIPLTDDIHEIRVLPASYSAYIAAKQKGSEAILGNNRFNAGDEELDFWVPVHKLFDGTECLAGVNLSLQFDARHTNEKIAKIHKFIAASMEENPGSNPSEWGQFPFKYSEGIADFDSGAGLVMPVVHNAVVEQATVDGNFVSLNKGFEIPPREEGSFEVNGNTIALFSSSMELRSARLGGPLSNFPRAVPEYAHIRTEVENNGDLKDLNAEPDLINHLQQESFDALHHVDFSGDGYVRVAQIAGGGRLNDYTNVAAYSIVAPPDFFPYCEQAELFDDSNLSSLWSTPPNVLADTRFPPNIQSHPELFFKGMSVSDTSTAMISGVRDTQSQQAMVEPKINRVSYLTDGAAGIFAPGWDTSFDVIQTGIGTVSHLSAYGLGSPFPEDAKLCAALSSFWPAVAPDITRSFWPSISGGQTVVPHTDTELGSSGNPGWDGETGPIMFTEGGEELVSYTEFERVDYTKNALENKFNYHLLAGVDAEEYVLRLRNLASIKNDSRVNDAMRLISYTIEGEGVNRLDKFIFADMTDTGRREDGRAIVRINQKVSLQVDEIGSISPF